MDTEPAAQRQSPTLPAKPVKPRKFRSSCDACSASKVKCDQEQPRCIRCTNLGINCNYSPSRRMGKPPASARKLTTTSNTSNSSNPSSSESEHSKPRPAKKRQLSPPAFNEESHAPIPTTEHDHSTFDPSLMLSTDDFMSMNWQDDLFQTTTFDGSSTADIQLTAANLFDLSFDFMGDSTQQFSNNHQFIFGDESLASSRVPSREKLYEPLPVLSSTSTSSQSSKETSPCSRRRVPKLCTHDLDFSSTSLPSPYPSSSNSSIDQVLIKNKIAIENAYALLGCNCSQNPHYALTLAMICIKILTKYEEIIKATPMSALSPNSGSRRGSDDAPISITVGAYKMDAEDEERMRIQIVVNELRKVKGLVDHYAKKYCTKTDGTKTDTGEGIYSALEIFLRSKLTRTLSDLYSKLEC
jgi:hypothetical protein